MALLISKSETALLTIEGTSIGLDSVYVRLDLASNQNGINMHSALYYYVDKAAFDSGSEVVSITGMESVYYLEADQEAGESQTILVASEKIKAALEEAGYAVEIVDL